MAAKVVMVAVPTVLGIASIRVYRVSDAPVDGLIAREKLSVYAPLSPQFHFVSEEPGALQSGLTNIRESLLPYVQAAQGTCVSVKKGTINLYHAGEDAYYYLKDPPPGFLPRLGSITMAGLLGMFLARKGSSFKRLAVPLGLMSAGASVCYPAQAVAVLKVTGKKVYATGQWSSATVSSLFTSKPKEHVAEEPAAPQPQSTTVPKPESPVVEEAVEEAAPCHAPEPTSTTDSPDQTIATSETEIESAESFPVTSEAVAPVLTEEPSSITHAELPDQTPAETTTDPIPVESVPADSAPASEELLTPVESSEPSASTQTPEAPSSEDSLAQTEPSPEPEAVLESVPAEATPASEELLTPVESDEPSASTQTPEAPSSEDILAQTEPSPEPEAVLESVPAEATPASEEPPAPKPSDPPAETVIESAESQSATEELSEKPSVAAAEETLTATHTPPPPPEQISTETTKGGSGFQPDPALTDYGQSNPEDDDLYSTRS